MLRKQILSTLIFILILCFATASGMAKSKSRQRETENSLRILESSNQKVVIEVITNDFSLSEVTTAYGTFNQIDITDYALTSITGAPQLPVKGVTIGIPPNAAPTATVVESETSVIPNVMIYPTPKIVSTDMASPPTQTFFIDEAIYSQSDNFPQNVISVEKSGYLRDQKIATVTISPFQFNPALQKLTVYRKLVVQINFSQLNSVEKRNYSESKFDNGKFENLLSQTLVNYEHAKHWRTPRKNDDAAVPLGFGQTSDRYKIIVDKDGIYRIPKDSLDVADIDLTGVDLTTVKILNKGDQIPIRIYGSEDGTFDDGDYIEFHGKFNHGISTENERLYYDPYSDENVYYLTWNAIPGLRLVEENGGILETDPNNYTEPAYYPYTVHAEEDRFYNRLEHIGQQSRDIIDHWFWESVPEEEIRMMEVNLPNPSQVSGDSVHVRAGFFGKGNYNRNITLTLDGRIVASDVSWYGKNAYQFDNFTHPNAIKIANNHLAQDINQFSIIFEKNSDQFSDNVFLNWVEITYDRVYYAQNNYLEFTVPSNFSPGLHQFRLFNFDDPNVVIYKKGSGRIVNSMVMEDEENEGKYIILFQDYVSDNDVEYIALTEENVLYPANIYPDTLSSLRATTNAADLIIVTHTSLLEAAEEYSFFKYSQGMNVKVVNISDIYDEFNYGIRSPYALRDFIKYAYENWQSPAPQYVLLFGDGSHQYKNPKNNLIPLYMHQSRDFGSVAADNWFACITEENGVYDNIPDIFIGRIPAQTPEDAQTTINKLQDYQTNPETGLWRSDYIFISGNGSEFIQNNERIVKGIPDEFNPSRVYVTADVESPFFGSTQDLLNEFDEGALITVFLGHGGGGIWSDKHLMGYNDIPRLNNRGRLPLVLSMTCFTGSFDNPGSICLMEQMLSLDSRGAVGGIGSAGVGYVSDYKLANEINNAFFQYGHTTMGGAITLGKILYYNTGSTSIRNDVINMYNVFGDPSLEMALPQLIEVDINPKSVVPGDTLFVSAELPTDFTGSGIFSVFDPKNYNEMPYYENILQSTTMEVTDGGTISWEFSLEDSVSDDFLVRAYLANEFEYQEIVGATTFSVGKTYVGNIQTSPETPTNADSVILYADIDDPAGINEITCFWNVSNQDSSYDMIWISENRYRTEHKIPPSRYGLPVSYHFEIETETGEIVETSARTYDVVKPAEFSFSEQGVYLGGKNVLKLCATVYNSGGKPAADIPINFGYKRSDASQWQTIHTTIGNLEIEKRETVQVLVDMEDIFANYDFYCMVNPDSLFGEQNINNNRVEVFNQPLNKMNITATEGTDGKITTSDEEFSFRIEEVSKNTVVEVNNLQPPKLNQPDLAYQQFSGNKYYIYSVDFSDSTAQLLAPMNLTFHYTPGDTNFAENPKVYIRNLETNLWHLLDNQAHNPTEGKVSVETWKPGTFALLDNLDSAEPTIRLIVENQEFASGGYASHTPTISAVINDENGIDFWLKKPVLLVNDNEVDQTQYVYNVNSIDPTTGMISYKGNFDDGNYIVKCIAFDCNGNRNDENIEFNVVSDFDIINIGNYPNPVLTRDESTTFIYTLTDKADDVSIKIYTVSGRLVKTITEGAVTRAGLTGTDYHEVEWDCRTDDGDMLANGVYFYRITAKKDDQNVVKTKKMSILR